MGKSTRKYRPPIGKFLHFLIGMLIIAFLFVIVFIIGAAIPNKIAMGIGFIGFLLFSGIVFFARLFRDVWQM